MTSLIHPSQKRAQISLKFEVVFNYDTFFKVRVTRTKLPAWPKISPIDGTRHLSMFAPFLSNHYLSLFLFLHFRNSPVSIGLASRTADEFQFLTCPSCSHSGVMPSIRVSVAILVLCLLAVSSAQDVCADHSCAADEMCVPRIDGLSFKPDCVSKTDTRFKHDSAHAGGSSPPSGGQDSGASAVAPALLALGALMAAVRLM